MKEGCYNDKFFSMFDQVDVVLDIMMTRPGFPGKGLDEEHLKMEREFIQKYFGMMASKKKLVQIRIPSKDNAMEAGMDEKEFEERLINACDIDYEAVQKACEEKVKEIAVTSDSDRFNEFLAELPPNGNVVCELGIGMNPGVTDLCGYEVLDEKMIGTFHIALGKNDMFGGKNDSLVHLDFVGKGELIFQ